MRTQACLFTTCIITLSQHRCKSAACLRSRGAYLIRRVLKISGRTPLHDKKLIPLGQPGMHYDPLASVRMKRHKERTWACFMQILRRNSSCTSWVIWLVSLNLGGCNSMVITCDCGILRNYSSLWACCANVSCRITAHVEPKQLNDKLSSSECTWICM